MHRWIFDYPKDITVDHRDHNTLDNRRKNLRQTNKSLNCKNRSKKNSNNKSGYRNVQWDKARKKWSVLLQVNGKTKWLGAFEDVDKAGDFAEQMRNKYYGEFAGKN